MSIMSNPIKQFSFAFLIFITLLISSCTKIDFSDRMINLVPSTGALSPNFSTLVLFYDLAVPNDVNTITLTPTLKGENVTVTINGVVVASGSASQLLTLNRGDTEIKVDVASETINYNYVVTVIRARSANAFLSDLTLSQGQLTPELEDNSVSLTGYNTTVPYLTSSINITATLADPSASFRLNDDEQISGEASSNINLNEGNNAIEIVVTAENEVMTQTYQLNVTRSAVEDFAMSSYIKATNTDAGDKFGSSVAMWGNTLVVGAPLEESNATRLGLDQSDNSINRRGAAYVYEKDITGRWDLQAYLKPIFPEGMEFFGKKVVTSNNRVAVVMNVVSEGILTGRIEEYRKNDDNNWETFSVIGSPHPHYSTGVYLFGTDIVLSDKFTIVGFPGQQGSATGINGDRSAVFEAETNATAGAVYVYVDGTIRDEFRLDSFIKASNTGAYDLFGYSVALSGNTLAVGAPGEGSNATGVNGNQADNSAPESGAVYIFTYDNNTGWSQQAYLKASNTGEGDKFGSSVSLSGDTLVVGAPIEAGLRDNQDYNRELHAGATYVFTRNQSSNWSQQAYLKPIPFLNGRNSNGNHFGHDLYISGDTVVISAPDSSLVGAVGITRVEDLISDEHTYPSQPFTGAAYVFTRDNAGNWIDDYYIKSHNIDAGDGFGNVNSGYGNSIVLSAPSEDSAALFNEGGELDNSAENAGAAYIYHNAPFSNHNLALSVIKGGSNNDRITVNNLDTRILLNACTDNCNQLITRGQTIQLTPIAANASSEFVEWQGDEDCSTDADDTGAITVTILAETYCTAVFTDKDIQLTLDKNTSSTADGLIQATINDVVIARCDIGCDSVTSEAIERDSLVQITATAESGAFVAAWSGDSQCQDNATNLNTVTSVIMSSSKNCTALFSFPNTHELRLAVNAAGNAIGSVTAVNLSTSVALDVCSTDCSQQVIQGHTVQLTPIAGDASSEFLNWSGDAECTSNANGAGVTTVGVDIDTYCVAMFGEIVVEDIILTVGKHADSSADGSIQGSINGNRAVFCDIGCNSDVSAPLDEGNVISFIATAENGALVTAWSGDAECQANANSDNTSTSITMTASKTCTAQFDLIETHQLRLTVDNTFDGTGSINAFNIDTSLALDSCSDDCSQQIVSGQSVQLTPIDSSTVEFSHWSGDAACSDNVSTGGVIEIVIATDVVCTANFTETVVGDLTLTLSKTTDNISLDGSMSAVPRFTDQQAIVTCDIGCTTATSVTQPFNAEFDIFASPQDNFASVVGWTGDPQCAANASADKTSTWVKLTAAVTCTATFSAPL